MEVLLTILGILVAAAAGFYLGKNLSGNAQKITRLESELEVKQAELDAFRGKVTSHFEKTANLFNQVSDSYQSLYDHMAVSSSQLCTSATFRTLPQQLETATETRPLEPGSIETRPIETRPIATRSDESRPNEPRPNEPRPNETKPNPPHKTNNDESNLFDANNLYNAHDYRNQTEEPVAKVEKAPIVSDDKIVDFETAKEGSKEPALDYAIKENGVVNHNSLGVEGVTKS